MATKDAIILCIVFYSNLKKLLNQGQKTEFGG